MKDEKIVDITTRLERFAGKGGWTYAPVPHFVTDKKNSFGWVRVKGFIDNYEIVQSHLLPTGNGRLFLAVKAEIRKKLRKQVGDSVRLQLYYDDSPVEIPADFMECLEDEPKALKFFNTLTEARKKMIIDHIQKTRNESTRVARMAKAINELAEQKLKP